MAGAVVILNGPPRSGKTSIARAIQASFEGVWVNLGVDLFRAATPALLQPGMGLRPGGERPDIEDQIPALYAAFYASVAAHSQQGLGVVVDVGHHDSYSRPLGLLADAARRLDGLPALLVGVRCPIPVIVERRQATWESDAAESVQIVRERAALWDSAVHTPGIYDVEVDTSRLSPDECAVVIHRRLSTEAPTALRRLALL